MENIHSYPYMQKHTKKNHDKCHTQRKKKDWPKYNVTVLNILPKSDTTKTIFASWLYCCFVLTLLFNFATKYILFELVKWSKGNLHYDDPSIIGDCLFVIQLLLNYLGYIEWFTSFSKTKFDYTVNANWWIFIFVESI